MTDEEKQSARLKWLDDLRSSYGLAPMEYPPLVRWISYDEISSVMVPCMRDKGFIVFGKPSGYGISGDAPGPQNEAFSTALMQCNAMYTLDPRIEFNQYSKERGELVYEYLTEYVIPCVRRHGFSIPDLPSKETWLANPTPLEGYPRSPDVERNCPLNPPAKWIVGDG